MELVRRPYHFVKYRLLVNLRRRTALELARRRLGRSAELDSAEKELLRNVSLRIHLNDRMYDGSAAHYLAVGLSAMSAVAIAIRAAERGDRPIRSILDFPSGHGRVLRFLRARFPAAEITAAEIDDEALAFCQCAFAAKRLRSANDLGALAVAEKFDLIWCGSLITHIEEEATAALVAFFRDHLSPGGVCAFTTHGSRSADWIERRIETYGLSPTAQAKILSRFRQTGYGYADYPGRDRYGISLVSPQRMRAIALEPGGWREVCFLEHGWLDHQDVYAFTLPSSGESP
jgi:SAM-dependent methyltransferase